MFSGRGTRAVKSYDSWSTKLERLFCAWSRWYFVIKIWSPQIPLVCGEGESCGHGVGAPKFCDANSWSTSQATQGTDKVTAKITYVLLVKIITDEPIKSPNFYWWLSKKAPKKHWTWHFFISFLLHSLYIWKQRTFIIGYIFEKWLIFK